MFLRALLSLYVEVRGARRAHGQVAVRVCVGTNRYQGAPSHTNAEQVGLETPCAASCAQRLRKVCKEAVLKSSLASSS